MAMRVGTRPVAAQGLSHRASPQKMPHLGIKDFIAIVEERNLVGIDMPIADAGDLRSKVGAGECIVEVAELSIEKVRVRGWA